MITRGVIPEYVVKLVRRTIKVWVCPGCDLEIPKGSKCISSTWSIIHPDVTNHNKAVSIREHLSCHERRDNMEKAGLLPSPDLRRRR